MRSKNIQPIFFVLAFALAGCGGTLYQNPEADNAATLTIQNDSDSLAGLRGFKVAADCSGGQIMFDKTGGVAGKSNIKIQLKPDEPFSFSIDAKIKGLRYYSHAYDGKGGLFKGGLVSEMNCPIFATFTPRVNTSYVATYSATAPASNDVNSPPSCKLTLRRLENNALVEDLSLRERELAPKPFSSDGAFCK